MGLAEKQAKAKADAIIWAEQLYHYKLIGRAIGYSEDQLKRWREADKDFADGLELARTRFLNKRIKLARPDFLLERLEPEVFKQRTEQELNHNGEVTFINDVPRPNNG